MDAETQHKEYMQFFGVYCASDVDMDDFEAHLLAEDMGANVQGQQPRRWPEQQQQLLPKQPITNKEHIPKPSLK